MGTLQGSRAAPRVGFTYRGRQCPGPADVALSCTLGCGQGDESAEALLTALEGQAAQGDVAVTFLAVYVSC